MKNGCSTGRLGKGCGGAAVCLGDTAHSLLLGFTMGEMGRGDTTGEVFISKLTPGLVHGQQHKQRH